MIEVFDQKLRFTTLSNDMQKMQLPYLYNSFDFFRSDSIITNYFWDKDQRAFNLLFHSGAKKNFQISSNMLFTFWPKSNSKYLFLRFWKYHKYLLNFSYTYNKDLLKKHKFSVFFPLLNYDDITNDYGIYTLYDEFTSKYFYKPIFFSHKYESNIYEADSFLTVGLLFQQLFHNSKFIWSNPYINYYCWVSDVSGLQKSHSFANFFYDSNKKLYSLKNFYNFLYLKKFFKEYNSKKSHVNIKNKRKNILPFVFNINTFFFLYFQFYLYLRLIFFGYSLKKLDLNFCDWSLNMRFIVKTSLKFMIVSAYKLRNFVPRFFKLGKKKFFRNMKKRLSAIDQRFMAKPNWINVYPDFSLKKNLNKYAINSFHNSFFISSHIFFKMSKFRVKRVKKSKILFSLFENDLFLKNFLYCSFDNLDGYYSNIDLFYKNMFFFFRKFFFILNKRKNLFFAKSKVKRRFPFLSKLI